MRSAAMTIVRYEPWTLLSRFQRQFERALGETPEDAPSPSVSWIPHVDIREEAERFVVVADLPGVDAKDINVTAEKGVLAVRGERRSQKQSSGDGYERAERRSGTLAPMIKKVSPAVVNIATRGTIRERGPQNPLFDDPFFRRFFDAPPEGSTRERPFQSAGSGVIVDAKAGYVLTNAHVVENANEITVTLQDGRDLKAEVVGSDADSDVAVLKVKPEGLAQVALGDSAKSEVGDFVVAIGNPFGLQHTVTSGIISGLSRSGINPNGFEDFIQTDASINPGNSGGALVNLRGELIGINTAILSRTGGNIGIGFAIPVNMARSVMEQLIKFGSVKRGQLGVSIYSVTPDIAHSLGLSSAMGALVSQVVDGSPADKAGIRVGDVITTINGQNVKSNSELRNTIGLLRVGDKVDIGLVRDGKPMRVTAVIADNAAELAGGPASIHKAFEGATLVDAPDASGALVRSIEPGG